MINVDEESTKNIKIKKIVEEESLKKKENFDMIIFDVIDVQNSNTEIFIKYYISDTTTISNNFTKFFFKFKNFLKEEHAAQTHEKKEKKFRKKTRTRVSRK